MKKPETRTYIELLKRRVASLRLMSKELIDCRQSLVSMDLESVREHISYQQGLCSEIRFLDHELGVLRAQIVGAAGLQAGGMDNTALPVYSTAPLPWSCARLLASLQICRGLCGG